MKVLKPALDVLTSKLRKYYSTTEHKFVYTDAVIFQPHSKLTLFKYRAGVKKIFRSIQIAVDNTILMNMSLLAALQIVS
jgi:hypothetical protein